MYDSYKHNNIDKMILMGRLGTPDEVADAELFLATNEYAKNCILNLDRGFSAI
jgi:3-oxoacyl-[acyl-carrier protein] reductase